MSRPDVLRPINTQEIKGPEIVTNVAFVDFAGKRDLRGRITGVRGFSPIRMEPVEVTLLPKPVLAPIVESPRPLRKKLTSPIENPLIGKRKKENSKKKKSSEVDYNPNERRRSGCRCPDPHDKSAPPCKSQWCPKKRGDHRLGANRALSAALRARELARRAVRVKEESRMPAAPVASRGRR